MSDSDSLRTKAEEERAKYQAKRQEAQEKENQRQKHFDSRLRQYRAAFRLLSQELQEEAGALGLTLQHRSGLGARPLVGRMPSDCTTRDVIRIYPKGKIFKTGKNFLFEQEFIMTKAVRTNRNFFVFGFASVSNTNLLEKPVEENMQEVREFLKRKMVELFSKM